MTIPQRFMPTVLFSDREHEKKYRGKGEDRRMASRRVANALQDSPEHFRAFYGALKPGRFLPPGRVQAAAGSGYDRTMFNCFVSGTIPDSMAGIMDKAKEAAETMRKGGGIGYNFSTIRHKGSMIKSLGSGASGPLAFMDIYDTVCASVSAAGNRRGAQMGVLDIDHPDIMEFVHAKTNEDRLRRFNVSVWMSDEFMIALKQGERFPLRDPRTREIVSWVHPDSIWDAIMANTWDWAEPGIIFGDRVNHWNNLRYLETIKATNPCGEQPLPPYGACLLGSFNLVQYLVRSPAGGWTFDDLRLRADIPHVVRAMDNVIDRTVYPLPQQESEAKLKRRMGLGITGFANASEILGFPYASGESLKFLEGTLRTLRDAIYMASVELAVEKGPFPGFDRDQYLASPFIQTLPDHIQDAIYHYGIRNSHLLSIAPTGTISLTANNVSSGIEPVFAHYYDRTVQTDGGPVVERIMDHAYGMHGVKGRTADELSVDEHLAVQALAQKYVDSSISKTINVGSHVSFEDFKAVYTNAYEMGIKGVTTFRAAGKRYGILNAVEEAPEEPSGEACYIDQTTGKKTCE